MSRYPILTIEAHQKAIQEIAERSSARILNHSLDDSLLSDWSDQGSMDYHQRAIEAIKLGQEHGLDCPAGTFTKLFQGERMITATLIDTKFGLSWILSDAEAEAFGRRFIPTDCGGKSRIQKKLGLSEKKVVLPVQNILKSMCHGVGYPISHACIERASA